MVLLLLLWCCCVAAVELIYRWCVFAVVELPWRCSVVALEPFCRCNGVALVLVVLTLLVRLGVVFQLCCFCCGVVLLV